MQTPSIGRIVLYKPLENEICEPISCYPAIIVEVVQYAYDPEDYSKIKTVCTLNIFCPWEVEKKVGDTCYGKKRTEPFYKIHVEQGNDRGQWHWPEIIK